MSSCLVFGLIVLGAFCTLAIIAENIGIINNRLVRRFYNSKELLMNQCLGDCFSLRKEIVSHINTSIDPCSNIYSYMCSDNNNAKANTKLKYTFPSIQAYVADILRSSINTSETKFLATEKILFQQCLKLDNKQDEENLAYETFYREVIEYVKYEYNWQDFHNKLNSLGFGYSFYDFKVIPDPKQPTKNIILLYPPSIEHIRSINEKIRVAMNYKKYYKINPNHEEARAFHDLYDFVENNTEEQIQEFFDKLFQIVNMPLQNNIKKSMNIRTTISELNNYFVQLKDTTELAEMEWTNVINKTFKNVGIDIDENENIVIKNRIYFIELAKLLNKIPNDVIISAMLTKIITENLMYIDWNLAQTLNSISKTLFCLEETKLYAASHKFLYDLIYADYNDISLLRKTEKILSNIITVLNAEINGSTSLFTYTEQTYLRYKLKLITDNIFEYLFYPPSDFYSEFEATPSYFFNIIEYRHMLKNKELRSLRENIPYSAPFSITDLKEPRNRFMLNVFINNGALISSTMPKEFHYGVYGVKVAGFLYSLMHENKFPDVFDNRKNADWFAYPEYSNDSVLCFKSNGMTNYDNEQISNMITEIFGLRIAYAAMSKETSAESHDRSSFNMLLRNRIRKDQLFFLTYAKSNCHVDDQQVNIILSYSEPFCDAFECYALKLKRGSKCMFNTFKIQSKNPFYFTI